MAKQEKIKKGMNKLLVEFAEDYKLVGIKQTSVTHYKFKLLGYLQDNDVVLKVERELPKHRLNNAILVDKSKLIYELKDKRFCFTQEYKTNYIRGYSEAQQDMLEAGYVAVEKLVDV